MNQKDEVPEVHAAWTNKLAFAAKHAFHDFFFQMMDLSPLDECMDSPDVEISEMTCRTGGSAASAAEAKPDRWFCLPDKPGDDPVIRIKINLPVLADRISK